uniref:Endonuclease/exonuclease/phosphatase family domain-containing protein 1 n=1 Tax=Timema bartmani TaxID=61472 RepID=A0A7R9F278_9NEOP|nr:unnamed protein product [Timema bartmani]
MRLPSRDLDGWTKVAVAINVTRLCDAHHNFVTSPGDMFQVDQLNVNSASEEELMTLSGITRAIAQNIVEYRQAIGRFKKVEDLALVSGIGAEKLDLIRPEICVGRRRNASCASSRTQSFDSLPSSVTETASSANVRVTTKNSPRSYGRPVNANTASVFELMTVHGLNQELAANVVHHRERRGPFSAIEDLLKVKGINQWRLGAVRSQLLVEAPPTIQPVGINHLPNGDITGSKRMVSSQSTHVGNGFSPAVDVFELLSAYSHRPVAREESHHLRNEKPALRLGTWNLHQLTVEKVENAGVRETICRTILENGYFSLELGCVEQSWAVWSEMSVLSMITLSPSLVVLLALVAVQEVVDELALRKVCEELNYPTLCRVAEWKGNEREWKFSISASGHGLGFLYDSSCNVELLGQKELFITVAGASSSLPIEAVLATFKLAELNVCLLNVYLHNSDARCIASLEKVMEGHVRQTDMFVILGDFTGLANSKGDSEVQRLRYKNIVPLTVTTSSVPRASTVFADNIFLNTEMQLQFTGMCGVVRQGLTHLAIPWGWAWGGPASEHCPVWCEVYTEPLLAEKVVPNGRPSY